MQTIILSGVCAIFAAIVGAFFGALIPQQFRKRQDKKDARIAPMLAIWDNRKDNVEDKLKSSNIRWFIEMEDLSDYFIDRCFFFVLRVERNQKLVKTEVCIETSVNKKASLIRKYKIGILDSSQKAVIPICYHGKRTEISLTVIYQTPYKEKLEYTAKYEIENDGEECCVSQKEDSLDLVQKGCGAHHKNIFQNKEIVLTENFSSKAVKMNLDELKSKLK